MAFTINQILTFLDNKKKEAGKDPTSPANSSMRYYNTGVLRILVSKGVITLADLQAEFPELA